MPESDRPKVYFYRVFEVVGKLGAFKLPKPKSIEELQNSSEEDKLRCVLRLLSVAGFNQV